MRRWNAYILLLGAAVCSSCADGTQDTSSAAQEAVESALSGKQPSASQSATEACELLESVIVPAELGVEAAVLNYTPASVAGVKGRAVCISSWDRPDKDALLAAYVKATTAAITGRGKYPKVPKTANEVSLTILSPTYASAAEAAASLEAAVAELSAGITVEVGGNQITTKVVFEDWLTGVEDKAVWAPEIRELSVASKGVRYAVVVNVSDDDQENKAQAIEIAERIGAKF